MDLVITNSQFSTLQEFQEFLKTKVKSLPTSHNRPIKESAVVKMKDSIETIGVFRSIILVNTTLFSTDNTEHLYTIDGQHLGQAIKDTNFKKLRGWFEAKIINLDNLDDINYITSVLNDVGEKWKLDNFLRLWVARDRADYVTIFKNYNSYGLNPILEASNGHSSKGNKEFKRGEFTLDAGRVETCINLYKLALKTGLPNSDGGFGGIVRFYNDKGGNVNVVKLQSAVIKVVKNVKIDKRTGRDIIRKAIAMYY